MSTQTQDVVALPQLARDASHGDEKRSVSSQDDKETKDGEAGGAEDASPWDGSQYARRNILFPLSPVALPFAGVSAPSAPY
jgi:uncharacterized protein involved in copper resistance